MKRLLKIENGQAVEHRPENAEDATVGVDGWELVEVDPPIDADGRPEKVVWNQWMRGGLTVENGRTVFGEKPPPPKPRNVIPLDKVLRRALLDKGLLLQADLDTARNALKE